MGFFRAWHFTLLVLDAKQFHLAIQNINGLWENGENPISKLIEYALCT